MCALADNYEEDFMIKAYIKLNSFSDITRLHEAAKDCNYDLVIEYGTVRINPKSLMSLFTVEIKQTMALIAKYDDKKSFSDKFGSFINL